MNSRKILSLLYHKIVTGRKHWRNLKLLKEWQWLPPEQLKALCDRRRKDLLAHAANHVPYYGKVLRDAGVVDAVGNVNLNNFNQIPLLDKDTIRAEFEALTSDDKPTRKGVFTNHSGGSTGEPILLLQDSRYAEWNFPSATLGDEWTGCGFGQKKILLWGDTFALLNLEESKKDRWQYWLKNENFINAILVKPKHMKNHLKFINREKPVHIRAMTESIYDLARFIENNNLQVHSPKSIVTSAGTLFPHIRQKVEEIFQAPVFNRYGSQEIGVIAYECEKHNGLHHFSPVHHLEILRPDGTPTEPGEAGEVVVTLLSNYIMPLIRYRIGDVAAWAENPCPCGRSFPLLKEVKGRINDIFIHRDGTHIHGQFFVRLFCCYDWVRRFQVIQEDYDLVKAYIMPIKKDLNPEQTKRENLSEVEDRIKFALGPDCRVEWNFVDEIPPSPSGKHLHTISKVKAYPRQGETP